MYTTILLELLQSKLQFIHIKFLINPIEEQFHKKMSDFLHFYSELFSLMLIDECMKVMIVNFISKHEKYYYRKLSQLYNESLLKRVLFM